MKPLWRFVFFSSCKGIEFQVGCVVGCCCCGVFVSDLLWQLRFHLLLQSAQQEGTKHLVQAANDQDGLLLIQVHLAMKTQGGRKSRSVIVVILVYLADGRKV